MMQKALAEIVEEIEKQKSRNKQTELLLKYSSRELKTILGYGMDPDLKWLLPETDPPYVPLKDGSDQEGRFYNESQKLMYFVNSPEGNNVRQTRREQLFIQVLESIDPRDAKLLLRMKNKKLKIKMDAVKEAFPNLVKDWGA
jgi:hypothetical protein